MATYLFYKCVSQNEVAGEKQWLRRARQNTPKSNLQQPVGSPWDPANQPGVGEEASAEA